MQFLFFQLFWTALSVSAFCGVDPYVGMVSSIAVWVTLLLWMWVRRSYSEDTRLMRTPVVILFSIGFIMAHSLNYFIIMGPALLVYFKVEGGYNDECKAGAIQPSDTGCSN